MKATLVLLPLLGITYMLFFVNPGEDEVSRVVFIYFNSFLESFQVQHPPLGPGHPHSSSGGHSPKQRPGGAGGWEERGWPEGAGGPHPSQSLDPPPPSTLGFLRVCVLLFPQQRGKDPGLGLRMAEACWDQRWSVASSCPPHAGPLLPAPRSLWGRCWEPQEGPCHLSMLLPRWRALSLIGGRHGGAGTSISSMSL